MIHGLVINDFYMLTLNLKKYSSLGGLYQWRNLVMFVEGNVLTFQPPTTFHKKKDLS